MDKTKTIILVVIALVLVAILAALVVPKIIDSIKAAKLEEEKKRLEEENLKNLNKSAAQQNAINKYKEILSDIDLVRERLPSKLFYITEKYIVLVKDGSLDTTIDIKDDVKVDTTSGLSIEGIDFDVNDWVVLESNTDKIYKYTSKNDGSTVTYVWTAYKIVNGRLQAV